ncbi:MAG TPA: tyrosine-type recombinase/integrase [Ktedonobacteraceae bacterium]|nr:tyrosine-type recombinase/integrase [Ktedonobacteraceae bacterium]
MSRRTQGEGSVYLRKDGRAAASAMYEGKRITKYGKTKKEAKEKLDAYLADLRSGRVVVGPKQTIEQYLTHWLENSRRLGIELTTLSIYRGILRKHLLPAFGHLQLNQLTKERVQSLLAEKVDAGYAPGTVRNIRDVLATALCDAVKDELLTRNVCDYVTIPKQKRHKPTILTQEQGSRLVAAARGQRLWFLLLVGLTTGARVGELLALRWSDIDMNNLRIHIHGSVAWIKGQGLVLKEPKTSYGTRKVLLAQVVIDAMEEQKEYIRRLRDRAGDRWKEFDLVFPNRYGGYIGYDGIDNQLKRILGKVGIPGKVTFHDLRHSMATLLMCAGVNPKVIAETLGHSNVSITLGMYGDVMPDMQQQAADVINRLFE